MESTNQHPGKNEDNNQRPLNQKNKKDYQHDDNKNEVDENGQKINWNDPEISEADNTQGRNPKNKTSDKTELQDHEEVSEDNITSKDKDVKEDNES